MPETITDLKPVYGPPELRPDWDDNGEPVNETECGWDLSWGCNLSFGHESIETDGGAYTPDPNGQLYVCVAMAGQMTQRTVTGEQLVAFGQMLIALGSGQLAEPQS